MRPWIVCAFLLGSLACRDAHREVREVVASSPTPSMPVPRGGAELIGQSLSDLRFDGWIGDSVSLKREHGGATLIRWWTDGCPFCEQSLPALDELRRAYEPRGLAVIAAYHSKSEVPLSDREIADAAHARHFDGTVAIDRQWRALNRAWPAELRSATSVTLLLDSAGVVRFAHPGPEFHRSSDPAHAECDADYSDLARAIEVVLEQEKGR